MTWQEFQRELEEIPLAKMPAERLGELFAFSLSSSATPHEREQYANAKSSLRQEVARRNLEKETLADTRHRQLDIRRADRQHSEQLAESTRHHTAQMEIAHFRFVFHRRSIWIAAIIAVASALFSWSSLWRQRQESRAAIESVMKRLDDLESRIAEPAARSAASAPETKPAAPPLPEPK